METLKFLNLEIKNLNLSAKSGMKKNEPCIMFIIITKNLTRKTKFVKFKC